NSPTLFIASRLMPALAVSPPRQRERPERRTAFAFGIQDGTTPLDSARGSGTSWPKIMKAPRHAPAAVVISLTHVGPGSQSSSVNKTRGPVESINAWLRAWE